MIFCIILIIVSILASISLPILDLDETKINLNNDIYEEEIYFENRTLKSILLLFLLGLLLILFSFSFEIYSHVFPFYYGGLIHYNMIFTIYNFHYFVGIILSPIIGSIIDFDYSNVYKINDFKGRKWLYHFLLNSKFHLFFIIFGVFFNTIINYLITFELLSIESKPIFFLTIFFSSLFLKMVSIPLYSISMLFLKNYKNLIANLTILYSISISILKIIRELSYMLNTYILNENGDVTKYLMVIFSIVLLFLCFIFLMIFLITLYQTRYYYPFDDQKKKDFLFDKIDTVLIKQNNNQNNWKILSFIKFIYYLTIEIISLIFIVILILFGSGFVNLIFFFYYERSFENISIVQLLFLPGLSTIVFFSLYISFLETLRELLSRSFFHNTRKLFNFNNFILPTLASLLKGNPRCSLCRELAQKNPEIWNLLNQSNLEEKLIIFITPDEIVLKDETKRIEIFEFDSIQEADFEIVNASNGIIITNPSKKNHLFEFKLKSHDVKFNDVFTDWFFLIGFFSYCLFFMIPTIFSLIQYGTHQ
jgi:hypothetical protein